MSLYVTTNATDLTPEETMAAYRAEGYTHVCAVGDPALFARVLEPQTSWLLALSAPVVNLAADDRSRYEHSLALVRETIVVGAAHGAALVSLSPGFALYGGLTKDGEADSGPVKGEGPRLRLLRALDQLANHADNHRIGLSLRLQADLGNKELMCRPEEADDLLQSIGAPHLGLGLDLGHVKLNARHLKRDPDDLVEGALARTNLVWLHGNEGARDDHERPKDSSWEVSQLTRPQLKDLPLVYDARRQPMAELRAVVAWLADSFGYTV